MPKPTDTKALYGDQTQPNEATETQYPHRYGYHPHGSLETHVHPYGLIHAQRPYTYGVHPAAT
jgi:hypothetical protein